MFCSISNTIPKHPVVSPTGYVFERELVLKYLDETGQRCPITNTSLSPNDLIELKSATLTEPRQPDTMSIPGLLGHLHSEWEALILETHSLRLSLATAREELKEAEFKNQQSQKVIQDLMSERDLLKAQLQSPSEPSDVITEPTSTIDFHEELITINKALTVERKKLIKARPSIPFAKDFSTADPIYFDLPNPSFTHVSQVLDSDYLAFVHNQELMFTSFGGQIKNFFDFIGTPIDFHSMNRLSKPGLLFTTSQHLKYYELISDSFVEQISLSPFDLELDNFRSSSLTVVPLHFLVIGNDRALLLNAQSKSIIKEYHLDDVIPKVIRCHVDGSLVFIGDSNNNVQVFDIKQSKCVSILEQSVTDGNITDIVCLENGSLVCASYSSNVVLSWNLRNPANPPLNVSLECSSVSGSRSGF
ncbi:hypothetical protein GEMRC1_002290 [Eukaryota sp. GEM-RC1]